MLGRPNCSEPGIWTFYKTGRASRNGSSAAHRPARDTTAFGWELRIDDNLADLLVAFHMANRILHVCQREPAVDYHR